MPGLPDQGACPCPLDSFESTQSAPQLADLGWGLILGGLVLGGLTSLVGGL